MCVFQEDMYHIKTSKYMKGLYFLCSLLFITHLFGKIKADDADNDEVYIVYMGSTAASSNNHDLLLSSLVER